MGGAVGGVAGLAILVALLYFFCKNRRKRDEFDGNFDPDRVVGLSGDHRGTLPDIDLAADNVTPYNYTPQGMSMPVPSHTPAAGPDMQQYSGHVPSFLAGGVAAGAAGGAMAAHAHANSRPVSPPSSYSQAGHTQYSYATSDPHGPASAYPDYAAYAAYANAPSSGHGHTSGSASPTSPSFPQPNVGGGGAPARDFRHPSPGPSLAHTSYTSASAPSAAPESVSGSSSGAGPSAGVGAGVIPSAKEREAMAYRRGGLGVANPDGAQGAGVLQHQDGGRLDATPEDEEPSEVPPRYDTIPHDR